MLNKELFEDKYRIQSARLYGYDYTWSGYYFVTICTKNMVDYFGYIKNKKIILNDLGKIAEKCWLEISKHFPFVKLNEFVVMPNHIHGIIIITKKRTQNLNNPSGVETQNLASLQFAQNPDGVETQDFASLPVNCQLLRHHNKFAPQSRNLSSIIRGYKIGVKKCATLHNKEFNWQERFHDRIIRNKEELKQIKKYIKNNPKNWEEDRNNLNNVY